MHLHLHVQVHVRVRVRVRVCVCVVVVCCGCWKRKRREETNRIMSQLIPSAVSLRIAETEQLYQAQRMIGGIGNVLLSTYSRAEIVAETRMQRCSSYQGVRESAFLARQRATSQELCVYRATDTHLRY